MRCGFLQKAASATQIRSGGLGKSNYPQKWGGCQLESAVEKSMIHGFVAWTGATID